MSSAQNSKEPSSTPFDVTGKSGRGNRSARQRWRALPQGTALGLAITAGALAVIFFSAVIYRLTPQPKSPYLVGNRSPRIAAPPIEAGPPDAEVITRDTGASEERAVPAVANESPESPSPELSADERLKEERRIQEKSIAEQRALEDKKRAIERQIEDKKAEEKRRLEDKAIEDARVLEDKKLQEARDLEDKRLEDERRLEAEREEAAAKLAATQP